MSDLIDRMIASNPLLGHGPRTHATGIAVSAPAVSAPRPRRRPLDVDAPKGRAGLGA